MYCVGKNTKSVEIERFCYEFYYFCRKDIYNIVSKMTMMQSIYRRVALFAIAMAISLSASWAQLKVIGLRIEHMDNPATVDAERPRFSWINEALNKKSRGCRQTATD